MINPELTQEFERQVENLRQKRYPKQVLDQAESLKEKLAGLELSEINLDRGKLPFVIVVKSDMIPTERMMEAVDWHGKPGIIKLNPLQPADFKNRDDVEIPKNSVYLLTEIDRGKDSLNVRPQDALKIIQAAGRSPLTIGEGIAIITQFPEFLIKNNCFSLLASRHPGDQRVPAIWINAKKKSQLRLVLGRQSPHMVGFSLSQKKSLISLNMGRGFGGFIEQGKYNS